MGEQQSQKRGLRSDGQKLDDARNEYDPQPATSRAGGAFGKQRKEMQTDQELALDLEDKKIREED